MMYIRYPMSLQQVEDMLFERGIDVCHETARFRGIKTLQEFASAHASIRNHFNLDRHLTRSDIIKENSTAALAKWRQLVA